jgi:hypothetical protein
VQRTHEEALFTPRRNTPFQACFALLGNNKTADEEACEVGPRVASFAIGWAKK